MICWVSKKEENYIKLANKKYKIPTIFCKTYKDFISQINDKSFLVISFKKQKIKSAIDNFSNFIFHVVNKLTDNITTKRELDILESANVIHCQYSSNELIQEFTGEIPSVYKKKLQVFGGS